MSKLKISRVQIERPHPEKIVLVDAGMKEAK